jgi:hypothetical protein
MMLVPALFLGGSHNGIPGAQRDQEVVSLCTLLEHPNEYNGKTVTVTATFAGGEEFKIFTDDTCQQKVNPESGKTDLVKAAFSQAGYDSKSALYKKLVKLLKKSQPAQVTVVGKFIDPGKYFGHQLCCRYQLEIQRLISVEEIPKSSHVQGRPGLS